MPYVSTSIRSVRKPLPVVSRSRDSRERWSNFILHHPSRLLTCQIRAFTKQYKRILLLSVSHPRKRLFKGKIITFRKRVEFYNNGRVTVSKHGIFFFVRAKKERVIPCYCSAVYAWQRNLCTNVKMKQNFLLFFFKFFCFFAILLEDNLQRRILVSERNSDSDSETRQTQTQWMKGLVITYLL